MQLVVRLAADPIALPQEIDPGVLGRKYRGRHGRPIVHHQYAAVRGIDGKEQTVAQRELPRGVRADGFEELGRVSAVRMTIDQLPPRLDRTRVARTALEREMLISVALNGGLMAMHFSPG